MPEFRCGSPVCTTRFTAPSKEELMVEVTRHVREVHRIPQPTKPILDYLEETAVHDTATDRAAG